MRHYFKVPLKNGKDIIIQNVDTVTKEIEFSLYSNNSPVKIENATKVTYTVNDQKLALFGGFHLHIDYLNHINNELNDIS